MSGFVLIPVLTGINSQVNLNVTHRQHRYEANVESKVKLVRWTTDTYERNISLISQSNRGDLSRFPNIRHIHLHLLHIYIALMLIEINTMEAEHLLLELLL